MTPTLAHNHNLLTRSRKTPLISLSWASTEGSGTLYSEPSWDCSLGCRQGHSLLQVNGGEAADLLQLAQGQLQL